MTRRMVCVDEWSAGWHQSVDAAARSIALVVMIGVRSAVERGEIQSLAIVMNLETGEKGA